MIKKIKLYYYIIFLKVVLGLVFILSGTTKLLDPASFETALKSFQLIPANLIDIILYGLPLLELILAVFIVFNFKSSLPYLITSLLLSFFTALILAKIIEGENFSCGCFGVLSGDNLDEYTVLRNVVLIVISIFVAAFFENKHQAEKFNLSIFFISKQFKLLIVLNLIFFLTTQNLIFALQNNGLKSRFVMLMDEYDVLKRGDVVQPFQLSAHNNTTIKVNYGTDNTKQSLLLILKPGCAPCKMNLPGWNNIVSEIDTNNARIFAISVDSLSTTHTYAIENSIPFKLYSNITDSFKLSYKAALTPQTILIDKNGVVLQNWKGLLTENKINKIINITNKMEEENEKN